MGTYVNVRQNRLWRRCVHTTSGPMDGSLFFARIGYPRARHFSEQFLEVVSMSARQRTELGQVLATLRPYQHKALAWSILTAFLSLAPSVYMFQVYDRVVNSQNMTTLGMLTLLVVGVYIVLVLIDGVRESLMLRAGRKLDQMLAVRVFDAVFAAQQRPLPAKDDQPQTDLRTLRDFVASPTALAFLDLPGALIFLLCIFWINPTLGFAALLGAVAQLLLALWTEQRTQPSVVQANRASMAAQGYARGAMQNAQVIESMGMLQGVHERWLHRHRKFLALQAQAAEHAGFTSAWARTLQVIQGSALLGLGCWLFLDNQLQDGGGMIIVASILGGKMLQPLVKAVGQWKQVIQVRDAHSRLEAFLTQLPARKPQMSLPAPTGKLVAEGLTVAAPGSTPRPPLLRNVGFGLPPGTVMAVIGPSGAGKSTLGRALLGLLPSVRGKVRLDGIDVYTRDKEQLGPHMGYLPQDVALFDGTLAQNVARFGEVDVERLQTACEVAGLEALIAQWPEGVHAPMGPDGAYLSGGQRQRVGLARALYGDPVLVVLDEPYSNMDDEGEAVVLRAVQGLKQRGATVVLITHLPSMLAVADALLVLRDGAVQHLGPRDEVLAAMAKSKEARQAGPAAHLQAREPA